MNENAQAGRTIYFDYLRIFATMAVIMLHTAAGYFSAVDVNGYDWFVFNFYDSIVRWAVPVFVMISGALFLSKKEVPIKTIYSKYVLRMVTAFIAWSFIYYIGIESPKENLVGLFLPGKLDRLIAIVSSHYHLWFIPMIAGLYMCLPVIRKIAEDETVSNYFLLLSLVFWFSLPWLRVVAFDFGGGRLNYFLDALYSDLNDMNSSVSLVCGFVFYFILGYKLSRYPFKSRQRIAIYVCGLLGFAFTVIADWAVALKTQAPTINYYGEGCVNVLLEAMAVFVLFKHLPFPQSPRHEKVMATLSKWSFGAYLVHVLVINALDHWGINALRWNSAIATPFVVFLTFVISFGISGVLNSIPIVKKYIV